MRVKVYLFASAVFMLLVNAAPLPAATAESVNLASVDACSLLTPAELGAAVGVPMDSYFHAQNHNHAGPTTICTWQSPPRGDGPPVTLMFLQLSVMPFAKSIFEQEKYRAGQENVTNVSGLGDDAYYAQIGPMTILNVKKGAIEVKVTWAGTTDDQTAMDAERSIAAQVLSEL
jgi:hypothetical protein